MTNGNNFHFDLKSDGGHFQSGLERMVRAGWIANLKWRDDFYLPMTKKGKSRIKLVVNAMEKATPGFFKRNGLRVTPQAPPPVSKEDYVSFMMAVSPAMVDLIASPQPPQPPNSRERQVLVGMVLLLAWEQTHPLPGIDEDEDLIQDCIKAILGEKRASVPFLQRQLRLNYTRATLIMDELERRGIVGPSKGAAPRDILIDLDEPSENPPWSS